MNDGGVEFSITRCTLQLRITYSKHYNKNNKACSTKLGLKEN